MSRKTLRIYSITHDNGWKTGILMRTWANWLDTPAPSAYGPDDKDIEQQLEVQLQEMEVRGQESVGRYLWDETFQVRKVSVDIHPQTIVEKWAAVGKRTIPLKLSYAWSKMKGGTFRVVLPRFGWRVVLEDLKSAPEVLGNALSAALLGENPRWVYDFRAEGDEAVKEWAPEWLRKRKMSSFFEDEDDRKPALEAIAQEWTEIAARKRGPLIVGEDPSVEGAAALIERDPPASILLVGPPGSGKTTWVRRLAALLARRRRSKKADDHVPLVWATSAQRIISGMVYVGMWQQRCLTLSDELSYEGDYLFVDRLPELLAAQPGGSSISDMLTPAVVSGAVSLIAECSPQEYERCQQRAPSLVGAMHTIRIDEPATTAMPAMMRLYQRRRGHKLQLHDQALKRLVRHLDAFERNQHFPGKGLRFLDWLHQTDPQERTRTLYPNDISAAYARFSGLPVELISDEHAASLDSLARRLEANVIGQPEPCRDAARILARFKAGLVDPDKPCGSLFFVGPTGVGKTELAKQLARTMFGDEKRLIRLDMSEYMSPGSSQRLLAIGPGITSLAEQVRQQPLSLILLDEIEKAHPEVFDLLLGVLGEGRLTDTLGRLVDFRMALIVMTSNLGAAQSAPVGFGETSGPSPMRAIRDHFRPEFVGRIDVVSTFRSLDGDDIARIADLQLDAAARRKGLERRNLRLHVTPAARARLAKLGHHPAHGARPLRRVIEERVVTPIAVLLAQDPALSDRTITVDVDGEGISVR